MSNFSKARKYLTNAEFESKVKDLLNKAELKISDQSNQITALNITLEKQRREIKELKKRERIIRTALLSATDQAKIAYEQAREKKTKDFERLDLIKSKYVRLVAQLDNDTSKNLNQDLTEIINDLKSNVGAGELARRRELEKARKKVDAANEAVKLSQKDIDARYKLVLEKYKVLSSATKDEFSIEEALNPTSSLEEIMQEIFNK